MAQSIARQRTGAHAAPSPPLGAAMTVPPARGLAAPCPGRAAGRSLRGEFLHDYVWAIVNNPYVRLGGPLRWGIFSNDFWGKGMAENISHKFYRPLCVVLYSPWTSCIVPYPGLTCSCPSGWRVIGLFFPSPAIPLLNVLCLSGLLGLGLPGKAQGVLVPSSRGTSGELEWEFPWCLSAHPIRRPGPLWRRKTCMDGLSGLCWGVDAASQLGIFTGSWASEITPW